MRYSSVLIKSWKNLAQLWSDTKLWIMSNKFSYGNIFNCGSRCSSEPISNWKFSQSYKSKQCRYQSEWSNIVSKNLEHMDFKWIVKYQNNVTRVTFSENIIYLFCLIRSIYSRRIKEIQLYAEFKTKNAISVLKKWMKLSWIR